MLSGGTHANVASLFGWDSTASGTVRAENVLSCFWRISLADSGEEAMIVVIEPSFRVMRGPWILDSSASDRLGLEPSSRIEPIIGRPAGPGGSFMLDLKLKISLMKNQQKISDMQKRRMESSIFLASTLV
ncbi:hypothetical protein FXO37_12633 [Capsicum annuum]|nr:hypothetical protein FXO37_12633 [Capsicum annuum]